MKPIKQSASWWCYCREGMDPVEFLKSIKAIGYAAVDFCPPEQFQAAKDLGLELSLVIGHQSLTDGMNKRENHTRIEDELTQSIETAGQFGVHNLCCFSGNRHFDADELVGAENCAEIMAKVAPLAEKVGVNLSMELLNSKVDHKGYQCDHTEWGVHMCKLAGSPRVTLLYDIYHMQIMEGDLIRTIRDNIPYISHFHTGGNPGRKDLDETQEIYHPPIARAIAELDYDGFLAHEFVPKGDPIEALKAAYQVFSV